MTRGEAHARISVADLRRQMGEVVYDRRLERSVVEEAPAAYRDIRRVLRAQKDLVVNAKGKDSGDIAYEWKKSEHGSYGLGLDVGVKTIARSDAPAAGAKKK